MSNPVPGMDTSSYQPRDLSALIAAHGVEHVVVKAYQTIEHIDRQHSIDQMVSARANGCSVGAYVWLYAGISPAHQVQDALRVAEDAGEALPLLWLDLEPYTDGSMPSVYETHQAVDECRRQGVAVGIYTGAWCWPRMGNTEAFSDLPLWAAVYQGGPTLNIPLFGGWTFASGHQYTSNPVDLSVFLPEVTGAVAAPEPAAPPDRIAELYSALGFASHDIPDGLEAEAMRRAGPRKSQVLSLAAKLRELSPT